MLSDIGDSLAQVWAWIDENVTLQTDLLASAVAVIALVVAARANRRATKLEEDARSQAGRISRVSIQDHALQSALEDRPYRTSQRDAGTEEGFVCSVHSGQTEVEVESVYLKVIFMHGAFGQERWEVYVDLPASEGLAKRAPSLPFRMKPHSRLDWVFPTFVAEVMPRRGTTRKGGILRMMSTDEKLWFEFGAYSRTSGIPTIAFKVHGSRVPGLPFQGRAWTKVVKHSSLWNAIVDPSCPDSLRAWFLEWLECRTDFSARLAADTSGALRAKFFQVVFDHYWPPGGVELGALSVSYGDHRNNSPKHRFMRTLLLLPDMTPVGSGRVVSGPGGSSEFSQVRLVAALNLLSGTVTLEGVGSDMPLPDGLTINDSLLKAATAARGIVTRGRGP